MKKFKYVVLAVFMFLFMGSVNAEVCSYETKAKINNEAANVKVDYETYEYKQNINDPTYDEVIEDSTWYGLIHIYNLTDNLSFKVIDKNGKKYEYSYSNTNNGEFTINTGIAMSVKNYIVELYYADSDCGKSSVRTFNVTIPRYNIYSDYGECIGNEDYYYCKQFVTLDDIKESEFKSGVKAYSEERKKKQQEEERKDNSIIYKTLTFADKYKWVIILVCVVVAGTIVYIVVKKRKERIV